MKFCTKPKLNFRTALDRKLWKKITQNLQNQNCCNTKKSQRNRRTSTKLYFFYFATNFFWFVFKPNCLILNFPIRPILNKFVMRFKHFDRIFIYAEEFGTRNIGEGYYKIRFNRSEGFTEIFDNRIYEIILAAKNWRKMSLVSGTSVSYSNLITITW